MFICIIRKKVLFLQRRKLFRCMLVLQDCVNKLADFKSAFGAKFSIIKLGIFGSVARKENTETSEDFMVHRRRKGNSHKIPFYSLFEDINI